MEKWPIGCPQPHSFILVMLLLIKELRHQLLGVSRAGVADCKSSSHLVVLDVRKPVTAFAVWILRQLLYDGKRNSKIECMNLKP